MDAVQKQLLLEKSYTREQLDITNFIYLNYYCLSL